MKVVLADSFKHCIKHLQKRFRHVKDDAQQAIETLEQSPKLGAAIPGAENVRKLRVSNSDLTKGKSGGYRLLYLFTEEPESALFLLLLYAKSDREDVTRQELLELLDKIPKDETPIEEKPDDGPAVISDSDQIEQAES
jgi:mRNA-degrading endonuclease RelE of RelBE toxin-antitoxin system